MDDESDRAAILNRRTKLVAAAMVGVLAACGDDTGTGGTGGPQACLSPGGGFHQGGAGGEGGVGGPQVCLGVALGGGGEGGEGGDGGAGGAPQGGAGGTGGAP
ncbi:MAG: hypothetical protein IPG04_25045 [Polyangiaceae bacterium]|nr:hypothetical protein [Polyangiaceae bacterium]